MSGPKHLWSGDWEQESTHAVEQRVWLPPEPEGPVIEEPEAQQRWRRLFGVRRVAGAVAVLAVAAVAVAVVIVTSSGGTAKPVANTQVAGPSASWLGMQIVSSPWGAAVSTVPIGSAGDAAGFEPGDVITEIGNDPISTPQQLRVAVANIPLGHQVQITIDRGSSIVTAVVTLRKRPTIQP